MSSSTVPMIGADPKFSLHEDGIWRSAIRQPIWSAVALDNAAIPQELTFFSYAQGQPVPGAGNGAGATAKLWHTNMTSAGQLGAPKKMRVDGVRLILRDVAFASANVPGSSDPTFSASATQDSDLLEDLLLLVHGTYLSLKIGEKHYAQHPSWMFPANLGYRGLAAVANDTVSASAVGNLDVTLPHTEGLGMNFRVYPFLIEAQQAIQASLRCPLASPPSLNDDRMAILMLTGTILREVS